MDANAPLSGLRVLDLTRNVAGPFASMILGDLGAEVIKVEQPGQGDDARHWGPPFTEDGESPIFLQLNRNKQGITLDLSTPEAAEVMQRLVSGSDVLLESFRPGSLDKLGFGFEWAARLNPRLIYTSVTAYGNSGPLRDRPGYDPLMQAFGGLMSITGEPGRPPVRVGTSVIDLGTGMWAAMATLAALNFRTQTGNGQHLVTSLYETSLAWGMFALTGYWADGKVPGRSGSGTPSIVPYRAFPTQDGYLLISAGNNNLFGRLSEVLGHPEWATDPRFATNPDRVTNREAIDELIATATRQWTSAVLEAKLLPAGIPCGPIRTIDQVAADEQAAALGIFQVPGAPLQPGFPVVGVPFVMGSQRPPVQRAAPRLGQDNQSVLSQLGFSPDEVDTLLRSKAFQPPNS